MSRDEVAIALPGPQMLTLFPALTGCPPCRGTGQSNQVVANYRDTRGVPAPVRITTIVCAVCRGSGRLPVIPLTPEA